MCCSVFFYICPVITITAPFYRIKMSASERELLFPQETEGATPSTPTGGTDTKLNGSSPPEVTAAPPITNLQPEQPPPPFSATYGATHAQQMQQYQALGGTMPYQQQVPRQPMSAQYAQQPPFQQPQGYHPGQVAYAPVPQIYGV